MYGGNTPQITITSSGTDNLGATNMTRSSATVYTYNYTIPDGDSTDATITLSVGTDLAGNVITTAPTSGAVFAIDNTAPTAAITYDSVGPYKNGETVKITATFNEAMVDAPVPKIAITSSGTADLEATNMAKTSSTVYYYDYAIPTGNSNNATITLSVGTDLAGNVITASPTSGAVFAIDNIAPTLSQITAILTPSNNTTPSYVFTTDEAGTITTNIAQGFSTNASASTGSNQTITFNTLPEDTYADKTITVTDAAGNASSLTIPTFVVDTTSPNMTITSAEVSDGGTSNDTTLALTFTSSEATSNFIESDITLGNGTLSSFNSTSSTVYTATFTPSGQGACTIDVAAEVYTDASTNTNNVATQFNWLFDTVAPLTTGNTVLTSNNSNGAYAKQGDVLSLEVQFTEAVSWTTASNATISFTIDGVSVAAIAATNSSNGSNKVSFNYTVGAGKNGAVALPGSPVIAISGGDSIVDAATNAMTNFALQSLSGSVTVDTTAPTLSQVTAITTPSNDTTPSYVFTTDEAGQISTNISQGFSTNATASTGSNQTITFNTLPEGTYANKTITVTDSAGNASSLTIPTFIIDTTVPTVISFTMSDTALKSGDTATVTLVFSEAVIGFSSGADITVQNGTLPTMTTSDNITWTGTFTPTGDINDTTNVLTLATSWTDTAGNAGPSASTANYSVDTTSPTMTITDVDNSHNSTTNASLLLLTMTSSEATSNFVAGDITVSNGTISDFAATSSTVYTARFTPTSQGACTIKVLANAYTDAAGNGNIATTIFNWTTIFVAAPNCFLKNTMIETDNGAIAIQNITPDKDTIRGKKVLAITQNTYPGENLILFKKNCLYSNIPSRDIVISPEHKVLYKGQMIKAKDFIELGKAKLYSYSSEIIYNVLLEKHEKMITHNMIVETLDPFSIMGKFYSKYILNKKLSSSEMTEIAEIVSSLYSNESLNYRIQHYEKYSHMHVVERLKQAFIDYSVEMKHVGKKRVSSIVKNIFP